MAKQNGHQLIERSGRAWQTLAEGTPHVLAATTLDELFETALSLSCELADVHLAAVHWLDQSGGSARAWVVAHGGQWTGWHHSDSLACPELCKATREIGEDHLRLDEGQLASWQRALPSGCVSLVLPIRSGQETLGALQFVSRDFATDLFERTDILKTMAKLIARGWANYRERESWKSAAIQYRNFLQKVNEGVFRFEINRALATDLPVEEQVSEILENSYLVECNEAMARMYGFTRPQEMVGMALTQLLMADEPRNLAYLENFVRNNYRLTQAESIEKDCQGRIRYFLNNLVGVVGPNGLVGAWGTQTDVTAQKDFEHRLTVSAQEAADASQAKSAFLANISHEIRTPLGVMLGFADLAADSPHLTDEIRGYVTAIRRNGKQVMDILGEVLDLSKIEASRLEIEEIRFPLVPMLSEVITFLDLHAREKGLTLSLSKIGPLPKVIKTDPTRLRQILTNLLGNAIKFTMKGHVTLSVRMASPPKAGTPVELEFTVTDTGIGIPPELKEKLFQPFTQAEISTTRRFGGTGLGLTLSKQLVQALGGDLTLRKSDVGKGSTFGFSISAGSFEGDLVMEPRPASLPGSLGQVFESPEENSSFQGKRVLVVEDSEDNQLLISRYLSAVGIQVELASNGFEGVDKAQSGTYDLVVMDIQMPGMDGHQCVRELRERGFAKPIIALTAHAFKEDREKAFRSGFNEYLTKPINRVVLLKTLSHRLSESSLH